MRTTIPTEASFIQPCKTVESCASSARAAYYDYFQSPQMEFYQHDLLMAGGLAGVGTFLFMYEGVRSGPLRLRKCLKAASLALSFAFGAVVLTIANWAWAIYSPSVNGATPVSTQYISFPFIVSLENTMFQSANAGITGFVFFAVASIGFVLSIRNFGRGWLTAFWGTASFFVVPVLLFLEAPLVTKYPVYAGMGVIMPLVGSTLLTNHNILIGAEYSALLCWAVVPLAYLTVKLELRREEKMLGAFR